MNARSVSDGTTDGAQVQNVTAGRPAAAAGILEGDVIVRSGTGPSPAPTSSSWPCASATRATRVPVELVRGQPAAHGVTVDSLGRSD